MGACLTDLGAEELVSPIPKSSQPPTPACCPSAPESHLPQKLQGVVSSEPLGKHLGSRSRDVVVS